VLVNQIKADAYRFHTTAKQHNFIRALPTHLAEQADQAMKDVYMLDFLGIDKPLHERQLELQIIKNIREVLLAFGHGFAFIGNQYKVSTATRDYYIDLLFFQRALNCLVAVELKTGQFEAEYVGKMNQYLNLLDDIVKQKHENPSIGIILCAERDRIDVEYALRGVRKPVGVAEYKLTKTIPASLRNALPDPELLEKQVLAALQRNK
jgi:predicted nuclease of restriction endonuclease-like (RecB) superfamily